VIGRRSDAQAAAVITMIDASLRRIPCPWCELRYRPCNLGRHVAAAHHRQLTIWDVFDAVENEQGRDQ
jgi:hypothetical protein